MKIDQLKKSISEMTLDEQLQIHMRVQESRMTIKKIASKRKKSGGKRVSKEKKEMDYSKLPAEVLEAMIKQLEGQT